MQQFETQSAAVRKETAPSEGVSIVDSLQVAMEHHRSGRLAQAEDIYRRILQTEPGNPDALHLLGLVAHQVGKHQIAADLIGKAIALAPNSAMHYNLGLALKAQGRLDAAAGSYQKAIALQPDYAEAFYCLAQVHQEQGRLDSAANHYREAIRIKPAFAAACNNLGNVLKMQGRLDDAVEIYRKLIVLKPDYAEAHGNLGVALMEQGRLREAVESYQKAIALKPDFADAYSNLGNVLQARGELDEAIRSYGRAIALKPNDPRAHNNLGALFKEQGMLDSAVSSYQRALAEDPNFAEAHGNLANALLAQGQFDAAVASYLKALSLRPSYIDAHSNLIFALSFHPKCSPAQLRAEAERYGSKVLVQAKPYTSWPSMENMAHSDMMLLRVGFVSGDLNNHPVGFFMEGILAHLDRARIQVVAYATTPKDDALTARVKPYFSEWNSIVGLSDEAAAKKIHADGIHVLIDLAGHTACNRLPVFAWKPAPVQVSWLGYFATTGVPGMDYLLADHESVPEPYQTHFTESVWYLPDTRLCFTPPVTDDELMTSSLPAPRNGYLTFGSFQNLSKLNDGVLKVWGRILRALPQARLRLQNKQMNHPDAREHLKARLVKVGIAPERLTIEEPLLRADYLAAHADVDILLDTFPYPGGTTTCEALWMGVPTLTLAGDTLLSRQGASLLSAAGLANWVATSEQDYVAKAIRFANDIPALTALRARLREQVRRSPLFDAKRFACNLEIALRDMLRARLMNGTMETVSSGFQDRKAINQNPVLSIRKCLDQGIALLNTGRLSAAIACYQGALKEAQGNIAILNNLANTLQAAGRFAEANKIYLTLLQTARMPLAWRIASNYLAGLQYQPEYSATMLKAITVEFGAQYGRAERLEWVPADSEPTRIGFISADLCDHPVGLFLLPLLMQLDRTRFTPILYSTRSRDDHTARVLQGLAEWHDIADLDHDALLSYLRAEHLHVLVDLAGHTAGNRLPIFARRAAPVQVSWLGYFATTGIPAMDAVIMDKWHAPVDAESQFSERLVRLPHSRFCYSPVPFAPEPSSPPCLDRGLVTFGSFNNTSKLNAQVFSVWAAILCSVPGSRLILKWVTFADTDYAQSVLDIFASHGVDHGRIELRGRSSHVDLLKEYADVDIALDPFPFTGGHTSCEALWMGLPVVTLPGNRPVSRQTLCFLANIGLEEFAAKDVTDYINIAVALAANPGRLDSLRKAMRTRMLASPLMDAKRFASDFECTLLNLIDHKKSSADTQLL